MVAIEVVHFMKSKTRGKLGNVALKLDISKAYDRIDWDYLKEVMIKMGFSHQWVKWVMMCVESVDYSVIVNDDMAYIMKNILSTYEAASGQAISLPKSEIFCSRNVSQVVQNSITNILGVQAVLGTGKYLGLPSMVGRRKKQTFNYIKDRVWRKINSWSSKYLSKAGLEVLIKSVLQAIPSYVMSIFLIPSSLIDAIEKMMNSFWWGHSGSNNKGIHWLAWDKLSVHKNKGGMGFKDLTAFNIAMLGKQGWKFQSSPNSLVSRLFKARYFPHSNFLASSLGHNPSYVWRSISSAKFLVREGARWCIGSGENISILGEPWIQGGTPISAPNPSVMHLQNIKVKHLISNTTKEWDSHVINNLFDQAWQSIGLWEKVEAAVKTTTTAATSIFLLLQQLDEQQATHMAALMWSIWKHRNLKLWQDVTETSSQVVARAIKLIEDWINAHKAAARQQPEGTRSDNSNASELRSINRSVQAPIRWRKPATGRYKCNIDASFSSHSNRVGIGICIRDDEGRSVLAKSMWLSPICNVDIGEALGLLHAIKWVSELQLDAVDFALDSKLVVDYFNKGGCDITEFGDIIGECKRYFSLFFTNSLVEFNRRQANEVAHALARVATSLASSNIFTDVPTCISQLIMNEML
ncbi:unnamed protein product [Trifolium pratense]|uniref:Uncharacterized protein n=1 Tax=Trifolium pratense TaxID=57577 RepID=A0ACB0J104_TRIPR|nr:unnamed protein product [Trifolium pratense]